jgi:hypothetical protein
MNARWAAEPGAAAADVAADADAVGCRWYDDELDDAEEPEDFVRAGRRVAAAAVGIPGIDAEDADDAGDEDDTGDADALDLGPDFGLAAVPA